MSNVNPDTIPGPLAGIGERVRRLRVSAGMTQTELAGTRFSKEYVSQIERGKTRPTRESVGWLAGRLGVDAAFLESGVLSEELSRIETQLARAEALTEAFVCGEAIEQIDEVRSAVLATGSPDLEARLLRVEAWARQDVGEVREAIDLLTRAQLLTQSQSFSDVDRADVLFRLGVCRYKLSSIATAVSLFDEALKLAERSGLPCDVLRSRIFEWRSRCRRRQRDYDAAREDVERALELAEALSDRRLTANICFQASLIAEREGHWITARAYAERAGGLYEAVGDEANRGRILNELGALNYTLGKPDVAVRYLKDAFRVLVDLGLDDDVATAVSSLAQVSLGTGDVQAAEEHARHALTLLAGREDRLDEIGNAQVVLGRSLLEQGRLDDAEAVLDEADDTFERFESASHRAAVWIAKGDLAARRGDETGAAQMYRRSATVLQDVGF